MPPITSLEIYYFMNRAAHTAAHRARAEQMRREKIKRSEKIHKIKMKFSFKNGSQLTAHRATCEHVYVMPFFHSNFKWISRFIAVQRSLRAYTRLETSLSQFPF